MAEFPVLKSLHGQGPLAQLPREHKGFAIVAERHFTIRRNWRNRAATFLPGPRRQRGARRGPPGPDARECSGGVGGLAFPQRVRLIRKPRAEPSVTMTMGASEQQV